MRFQQLKSRSSNPPNCIPPLLFYIHEQNALGFGIQQPPLLALVSIGWIHSWHVRIGKSGQLLYAHGILHPGGVALESSFAYLPPDELLKRKQMKSGAVAGEGRLMPRKFKNLLSIIIERNPLLPGWIMFIKENYGASRVWLGEQMSSKQGKRLREPKEKVVKNLEDAFSLIWIHFGRQGKDGRFPSYKRIFGIYSYFKYQELIRAVAAGKNESRERGKGTGEDRNPKTPGFPQAELSSKTRNRN